MKKITQFLEWFNSSNNPDNMKDYWDAYGYPNNMFLYYVNKTVGTKIIRKEHFSPKYLQGEFEKNCQHYHEQGDANGHIIICHGPFMPTWRTETEEYKLLTDVLLRILHPNTTDFSLSNVCIEVPGRIVRRANVILSPIHDRYSLTMVEDHERNKISNLVKKVAAEGGLLEHANDLVVKFWLDKEGKNMESY